MNGKSVFVLSALPVLAGGAALFYWQTQQLANLKGSATSGSPAARPEQKATARQGATNPPARRQPASTNQLLEKLESRIITSCGAGLEKLAEGDDTVLYHTLNSPRELTKEEGQKCWEAVLARRAAWAANTGASLEERTKKAAEIETQFEAALAAIMGADWAASRQTAQASVKKATAEYLASKTVTRVSDVIPLTEAQKDALHAAVIARNPTDATLPRPAHLSRFFKVETRPTPPSLSQEQLLTVLTEDQVDLFTLQRDAQVQKANAATQLAMQSFLPALIDALGEVAGTRAAAPVPAAR
jgi:hypothetical protein